MDGAWLSKFKYWVCTGRRPFDVQTSYAALARLANRATWLGIRELPLSRRLAFASS